MSSFKITNQNVSSSVEKVFCILNSTPTPPQIVSNFEYYPPGIQLSLTGAWTGTSAPIGYWGGVSLSASGQYQTAVQFNDSQGYLGLVYTIKNSIIT